MPDPPPLARSILDVIGSTPLIELNRSVAPRGLRGRLLEKLEAVNPGLSNTDRVALELIRRAREDGSLRAGQTVVALTSGNMGAGLAVVCGALGHPFVAVMSRGNSVERALQMTALGAEVHEQVKDVGGGIKVASVRDPFGNLFSIIENPHFKLGVR